MKYLCIFKGNWADEMDVEGFDILSREKVKDMMDAIEELNYPREMWVGTNEFIAFSNADELKLCIELRTITDDEVNTITKHFGKYGLGFFPFDYIMDAISFQKGEE